MPGPLSTVPVKKPLHLMAVKTQLVLGCKTHKLRAHARAYSADIKNTLDRCLLYK